MLRMTECALCRAYFFNTPNHAPAGLQTLALDGIVIHPVTRSMTYYFVYV